MAELDAKKRKRIERNIRLIESGNIAVAEFLFDIEDKIDELLPSTRDIIAKTKGDKGDKGEPGVDGSNGREGVDGLDGVNGKDGKDGKDGQDGKDAPPVNTLELGIEAAKIAEERLKPFIPTMEVLEKELPKFGAPIRDALELLQDEERLDAKAIKGLEKLWREWAKKLPQQPGGGGGIVGRDLIKDIDLSAQLNGVTTTFNIQAIWNVVSVSLSSYPYGSLRKGVDYSFTPTSITFLSTLDPATQLSAGQQCILTVVQA